MEDKNYEDFKKEYEENEVKAKKLGAFGNPPESFLIGEPIPWDEISEEENRKEWIWENYIAKRHVTLLSALWKAGKSTFLRCLFLAMAEEQEFAGQPTHKCKVLVISEEDKGEWSEKKEELEADLIHPIIIWSRPIRIKPNLKQWTELCEQVSKRCVDEKIDMVVVDTLTTFWPIDNENDSAQVIKALVPLYNFTENNIAVLLIHHFRKGGGDQAQASRGSGALPGFVDNIIEFTRNDDGDSFQRVLKTYGRFDEVIPQVVIKLGPDGTYKTLGEPSQVSKSARLGKILSIFKESSLELSAKQVFNVWSTTGPDITYRSIKRYINELVTKNILEETREEAVLRQKTPFYALKEGWKERGTAVLPYTMGVVLSSVNNSTEDNGIKSSVPRDDIIEATTEDRTGTSPTSEDAEILRQINGVKRLKPLP